MIVASHALSSYSILAGESCNIVFGSARARLRFIAPAEEQGGAWGSGNGFLAVAMHAFGCGHLSLWRCGFRIGGGSAARLGDSIARTWGIVGGVCVANGHIWLLHG